jgi:hypothetical protein
MLSVQQILARSGAAFEPYSQYRRGDVYLTAGNQLIGAFRSLKTFQGTVADYTNWQAHHIVETVDLDRLDITTKFPGREDQICVLLPERAHIGRVNSILRTENPLTLSATASELRAAYRRAYKLVGDYCGGGEAQIQRELMAIVDVVLLEVGSRPPG